MNRVISTLLLMGLLLPATVGAQLEPLPMDQGATGLALAIRQLGAGASYMEATAHPDDEDNGLLVMLSRGRGLRTALLTMTRGDGGQNMMGPELFEALGIVRSAELESMHRFDGVEQYFTRAFEFGYSFSVEETFQKWGKEEILADAVRVIRTMRPDVLTHMTPTGEGGGQHHQSTARLTQEAFRAAADPARFPEQIREGLRPWQPLKMYHRYRGIGMGRGGGPASGPPPPGVVRIDTGEYDPILGRSYAQIGAEARSMHRCQSMSQLRGLPGERSSQWMLEEAVIETGDREIDLFDGVETGLDRLRDFIEGEEAQAGFFLEGLEALKGQVAGAEEAFDALEPWRTLPALRDGLTTVRKLRTDIAASSLSDDAKYDLEHRLSVKEEQFVNAVALAHGIALEPIAGEGEVVPGEEFNVDLLVVNRSPEPINVTSVEVVTPDGWTQQRERGETSGTISGGEGLASVFGLRVADNAEYSRPYWVRNHEVDRFDILEPELLGIPFSSAPVQAKVTFRSGDIEVVMEEAVHYRYEGAWVGTEKQRVTVLPAVSINVSPGVVVYPTGAGSRTISVDVVYKGSGEARGTLRLEMPAGWDVTPSEASLSFDRKGEAAVLRFEVEAPAAVEPGPFTVEAVATMGGKEFREGYETIDYHHIEKRYIFRPSQATVQALDIDVAPVTVGYVMGVGDDVPEAIQQLGLDVTMLDAEALAEGDLSRFDIIVTGIRAYLNRQDLRAYNDRLIDYVEQGGTVLVQYNKFEFNNAQWGPYPIQVSSNRVTVEEAPMTILAPDHPVFNFPNRVTEEDWKDWVHERGTYFIGEKDDRYVDLLASEDPWPYNAGEKRGIFVETRHGQGRWIYTGLGFYRQLPEGVPDAFKFFANVLSLPKAPAGTPR